MAARPAALPRATAAARPVEQGLREIDEIAPRRGDRLHDPDGARDARANARGPHLGWNAQPPSEAKVYYKVVAVQHPGAATGPRFISIFDGCTEYSLDAVAAPPGGVWVSPNLLACIQHAAEFPSRSALYDAPRAILQVLGWGGESSWKRNKLRVAKCIPMAVLPYSAAAQQGIPTSQVPLLVDGIATLGSRPASAPPSRPAVLQLSAGAAHRMYGGGHAQGQRMQAMTVALHEEVLYAEERLRRLQNIRPPSGLREQANLAPWVQRALNRR